MSGAAAELAVSPRLGPATQARAGLAVSPAPPGAGGRGGIGGGEPASARWSLDDEGGAPPAPLRVEQLLLEPSLQRYSAAVSPQQDYNELPTYPLRPSYKDFHALLRPCSRPVVFDGCPEDPYRPASVPIYQTATFEQPSSVEFGSYDYTRSGNPTRTALEKQVAMLENAHAAFAFTTGMAALSCVTRLLRAGDTLLVTSDVYGGMHRLVSKVTSLHGIRVVFVPTWELDAVSAVLDREPRATMLHLETPSNPGMRISDLRALADLLHARGVLLSCDNTMMTPHVQQPLNHGADIVVHSMTKGLGGHSDVSGGIACVASEELATRIAFFQNAEGTGLAPFDCWLFLRGIKTLAVRVERAQENAARVAAFLRRQPLIRTLSYAGLEPSVADPDFAKAAREFKIHASQARGGGCVMSFTTGDVELSRRIVDSLRLFKLTVSFGSCNSLCEMPATLSHASIPASERALPDDLVRLSVGIEDADDLLEDLQQALAAAASPVHTSLLRRRHEASLRLAVGAAAAPPPSTTASTASTVSTAAVLERPPNHEPAKTSVARVAFKALAPYSARHSELTLSTAAAMLSAAFIAGAAAALLVVGRRAD
jgi:cystathionine beta-lyase